MQRELVRLSKRIALVLRHRPDAAGLRLDPQGWVPVDELLSALRISRAQLDAVVTGNDKQRYAVAVGPDGRERIRASQGHSVAVDLELPRVTPPAELFHGTASANRAPILRDGLHRARRHHVHLSADVATARAVGARRGGAVLVLRVDAAAMAADGYAFFRSANGVWLVDAVPPGYLRPLGEPGSVG